MGRNRVHRYLSLEKYLEFLSFIDNPRDELIFRLMGDCGLRVGEVVGAHEEKRYIRSDGSAGKSVTDLPGLRRMDRLPNDQIRVRGKGSYDRIVTITPRIAALVDALDPHGGAQDRYVKISPSGVRKVLRRVLVRASGAGSDLWDRHGREAPSDDWLTPHWFRHTFSHIYLQNGGSASSLQAILGHHNLQTTQIYTEMSSPDANAEMSRVRKKIELEERKLDLELRFSA